MERTKIIIEDEDGVEIEIPTKQEPCFTCEGSGKIVNPNIDGGGLTRKDFEESDFANDYVNGNYDVACHDCLGSCFSTEADWDKMSKEIQDLYTDWLQSETNHRHEEEQERRRGA